jgi:hypothetical protein
MKLATLINGFVTLWSMPRVLLSMSQMECLMTEGLLKSTRTVTLHEEVGTRMSLKTQRSCRPFFTFFPSIVLALSTLLLAGINMNCAKACALSPIPTQLSGIRELDIRVTVIFKDGKYPVATRTLERELRDCTLLAIKESELVVAHVFPRLDIQFDFYEHPISQVLGRIQLCEEVVLQRDPTLRVPGDCVSTWDYYLLSSVADAGEAEAEARKLSELLIQEFLDDWNSVRFIPGG